MSYLSPPQIYFKGTFSANVATGNNAGTLSIYEDGNELANEVAVFDMVRAQMVEPYVQFQGKDLSDAQIRQLMFMGRGDRGPNFNYMEGGNVCGFSQVEIVGADSGAGLTSEDSSVSVTFAKGSMVDLNPLGGNIATQIFGDQLTIGDDAQISGRLQTSFSRLIWWNRLTTGSDNSSSDKADAGGGGDHKGSAVFQSMIPKSAIQFSGEPSAVLQQFKSALASDKVQGLNVRYTLYQSSFEFQGKNMTSMSTVLGVIGLQSTDLATTEPPGRYLISPQYSPSPGADNNRLLGAMFAEISENRINLDMITAVPEKNSKGEKEDFGSLQLRLQEGSMQWPLMTLIASEVPSTDVESPIPTRSYGQAQYEATAGVLSAPLPTSLQSDQQFQHALKTGSLQLVDSTQKALLQEVPLRVVCDDRCIYMQENESDVSVRFQLLDRGTPMPNAKVQLIQFLANDYGQGFPPWDAYPVTGSDQYVSMPISVTTDSAGVATFTISGQHAGACVICFNPDGECWPNQHIDPQHFDRLYSFFTNVRVLPIDDYSHISDQQLAAEDSFDTIIYPQVLRYYYLLYPFMQTFLDLSQESAILSLGINRFRKVLALDATYPEEFRVLFEKFSYMPRTREMSEGKRTLLRRWCDANANKKP